MLFSDENSFMGPIILRIKSKFLVSVSKNREPVTYLMAPWQVAIAQQQKGRPGLEGVLGEEKRTLSPIKADAEVDERKVR